MRTSCRLGEHFLIDLASGNIIAMGKFHERGQRAPPGGQGAEDLPSVTELDFFFERGGLSVDSLGLPLASPLVALPRVLAISYNGA